MSHRPRIAGVFVGVVCLLHSTNAWTQKSNAVADQEYAVNLTLQRKPVFDEAAKRWKKFLTDHPRDKRIPQVHLHLGTCQFGLKQYDDAAKTYRTLIARYPKFDGLDAARFNLALSQYYLAAQSGKRESFRTAAKAFADVISKHKKSSHAESAAYYRAECLYQAGDAKKAVSAYLSFVGKYPKSELLPDVYYALGTVLQESGDAKGAAKIYQRFTRRFPMHKLVDECNLRYGTCLLDDGKHREAERVFWRLAGKRGFAFADFALLKLAQCRRQAKDTRGAIRQLQTLLKKHPKSAYRHAAMVEIGQCLYETRQFKQAEKPLRTAFAAKSADAATAAYWLAKTQIALKKPAEAEATLTDAIKRFPKSPDLPLLTVTRLDAIYEQPAKRKTVIKQYAAFASKLPQHELAPHARYMAAFAALAEGEIATAEAQSSLFLKNSKWSKHALRPEALFIAAESRLRAKTPKIAEAEKLYTMLVNEYPKHPQAARAGIRLGYCRLEAKQPAQAIAVLKKALQRLNANDLKAEAYLFLGRAYAGANRNSEAVTAFDASLQADSKWDRADEVMLRLAIELRRLKKSVDATRHLKQLLAKYPRSELRPRAFYELGRIAEAANQQDAALVHYKDVLKQHAKSNIAPSAAYGIGRILAAKGDDKNAVNAFNQLIASYSNDPLAIAARYDRALAYHQLKQHQDALTDLAAFLKSKPPKKEMLDARYAAALCQIALNKKKEAAENLEFILVKHSDYERADAVFYELAHLRKAGGETAEAAKTFEQLVGKFPTSSYAGEAWFHIGVAHRDQKKWKEAAAAYAAGLNVARQPAWKEALRHEAGYVQYRQLKYAEASKSFQQQLKEFPKGSRANDAAYFAGECLFQLGKFEESAKYLEPITKQSKARYHARALYRAATCAARLKEWPTSRKHYAALISAYPKFDRLNDARYGLGLAYQMQNQIAQARTEYNKILTATKGKNTRARAQALFMLGECNFREKKYRAAIVRFVEATVYPDDALRAQCHYEAGRCAIELKQYAAARKSLRTVVNDYPKSPEAALAKQLLTSISKK